MIRQLVKVLGMPEMNRAVADLNRDLQRVADPAALAAAKPIHAAWQSLVPVYEGNYKRSLDYGVTKGGVAIGTTWLPDLPRNEQPVLYAKRLEFGDSEIHPHPSMRPALAQSQAAAIDAAAVPIKTVIKKTRVRRPH